MTQRTHHAGQSRGQRPLQRPVQRPSNRSVQRNANGNAPSHLLKPHIKRITSGVLAKRSAIARLRPLHLHQSDRVTDLICIRTIKPHPVVADVVEHEAQRLLCESPYNELHHIRCVRRHGVTVLQGVVDSYFLKQLAQETIRGTNGITKINNNIFVNP